MLVIDDLPEIGAHGHAGWIVFPLSTSPVVYATAADFQTRSRLSRASSGTSTIISALANSRRWKLILFAGISSTCAMSAARADPMADSVLRICRRAGLAIALSIGVVNVTSDSLLLMCTA